MINVLSIQFMVALLAANIVWFISWPFEVRNTLDIPNKDWDYGIWFIVACVFWFIHAVVIYNLVLILLMILNK
jgi:hypothetical protein